MSGIVDGKKFAQVGYVVKDIEKSKRDFALLLGCEEPEAVLCGSEAAETVYKGQPTPKAKSKLAFFQLSSGVQLELIEPNEEASTWRDGLEENGEGIHHIAFLVEDMEEVIRQLEEEGMQVLQRGYYDDRSGWYAYLDGSTKYKCIIELLESF